jgi:hypothetical protein
MQEVVALTTSEPASADRKVLLELNRNYVRSALLAEAQTKDLQAAARVLNLQVHVLNFSTDREFDVAFAKIAELHAGGLVISSDSFFFAHIERLAYVCLSVRTLSPAKWFMNCLANYEGQIDAGGCAIYLWDDLAAQAVCLVTRHGRLGWSLSEALGPGNADLDRKQLQEITNSFARAGVPHQSVITAIETILQANCTTKSRTRRQRQDLEQRL